jgi:hypothetical protein
MREAFTQRLRAAAISRWELADLLGVHPRELAGVTLESLRDQPVKVLLTLARRLDLNPAELLAALDPALNTPTTEPGPGDADADALAVLAALYVAHNPLDVDAIAEALGFDLDRTAAALEHAATARHLAGPMALRARPGGRYTITGRLDLLTDTQRTAVNARSAFTEPLNADQAAVLLALITHRHIHGFLASAELPEQRWWREHEQRREIEWQLVSFGLLHCNLTNDHKTVDEDVRYSLQFI